MRTTIGNGLDVATSPQVLHAHLSKVLLDIAQVLTGRKIVFEMKTERSRSATQVAYVYISYRLSGWRSLHLYFLEKNPYR